MSETPRQVSLIDVGPSVVTATTSKKARRAAKAAERVVAKSEEDRERKAAHGRIVNAYYDTFLEARGVAPVIRAAEGKAVYTLLDSIGESKAVELVKVVFKDDWYRTRIGITILSVAADPSKFVSLLADRGKSGRHQQAPSPVASKGGRVAVNKAEDL